MRGSVPGNDSPRPASPRGRLPRPRARVPRPFLAGVRAAFEERADVRLRVAAIQRNFDAERSAPSRVPEPAIRPVTIALWQAGRQEHMNDFARAPRVLVVEDDEDIAQALQRSLRMEGYEVRSAADGRVALEQGRSFAPDLVILDLGLPEVDGLEVARSLRADDDVPILILTARDALESRVEGLDAGADDYLVKPFERQELLARLRALLRRRPPRGSAPLRVGDLSLNTDTHEVVRSERAIDLTQREFELLEYLMRNERIVISRQRLLDEVWGYDPFSTTNTIEVFVSNLRRKLEAEGEPRLLHTIRGAGYVLRA
jgi:DNA-binding response OmpR family regulator